MPRGLSLISCLPLYPSQEVCQLSQDPSSLDMLASLTKPSVLRKEEALALDRENSLQMPCVFAGIVYCSQAAGRGTN